MAVVVVAAAVAVVVVVIVTKLSYMEIISTIGAILRECRATIGPQ